MIMWGGVAHFTEGKTEAQRSYGSVLGARQAGGGEGVQCLWGQRSPVGNFWRWMVEMSAQPCECPSCHWGVPLKESL